MADKPVDEILNLDAVLDGLPADPSSSDVYEATLPFSSDAVAAVAARRALGGGGAAFDGAGVGLTTSPTVLAFDPVVFDREDFDTAGYFNNVAGNFVIPAGKGGLFLVSVMLVGANDPGMTFLNVAVATSGATQNCVVPCVPISTGAWAGTGGQIAAYAAGDSLTALVDVSGVTGVQFSGGGNGSVFCIQRLGDA